MSENKNINAVSDEALNEVVGGRDTGARYGANGSLRRGNGFWWYKIASGDNLSTIALRFQIPSYYTIQSWNRDKITNVNLIRAGDEIRLYVTL